MITPHGILVKVKGSNIHLRKMGEGERIIVLLPGLGSPLPTAEFAPLMRELSKKYTVCTIELFGYGHSDGTDTPRTNENYVEEIRETLNLAGLKPPYVLMPHSASGIYCEYYAAKYSEEIAGLILLDSTPTVEGCAIEFTYTEDDIEEMKSEYESFVEPSEDEVKKAIEENVAYFTPHGYTEEEIKEICVTPNHADTIFAQAISLSSCLTEVIAMPIPKEIPVLAFCSDLDELRKELKDMELEEGEIQLELNKHENYRKGHMDRLGAHAKHVIVDGSTHSDIYYHRSFRNEICKEIDLFLKDYIE